MNLLEDGEVSRQIGRPPKKPNYSREKEMEKLLSHAMELFSVPFDDRVERPSDAPSIIDVASKLNTSRLRMRKLLITANYYSTQKSRRIHALREEGKSIQEIIAITGLERTTVQSYLPYERSIYKLEDLSVNAEGSRRYQQRRRSLEKLKTHLHDPSFMTLLWETILAFEHYHFLLEDGRKIQYSVFGDSIRFDDITFSREEIKQAFRLFCAPSSDCPKELSAVFRRFGVDQSAVDQSTV